VIEICDGEIVGALPVCAISIKTGSFVGADLRVRHVLRYKRRTMNPSLIYNVTSCEVMVDVSYSVL